MLIGRGTERSAVDQILKSSRDGASAILVVRGEEGIGKTALLNYARESAAGMRVVGIAGAQAESDAPYAAAARLLTALGAPGELQATDTTLNAGRLLLGALSRAADDKPLLCIVDDAGWLDRKSAETVAAAARRLTRQPIALLLAVREPSGETVELEEFPGLRVVGLPDIDAAELLIRAVPGSLDPQVRTAISSVALGNPEGLLELAAALSRSELAGASVLPEPLPIAGRVARRLLGQVQTLPAETQLVLLLLAAEPTGDVDLLWRAAAILGLPAKAILSAESAGIVDPGPRVAFCHVLMASAVYAAARPADRRTVHQALADASDDALDGSQRAWHRAAAAPGPDEGVALALERSAAHASKSAGHAAAARFLRRAALYTADPHERTRRTLLAASAELAAGALQGAAALLTEAQRRPLNELNRALAQRLSGALAVAVGENGHSSEVLLEAARALEGLDARIARETYLEALEAALYSGRLGSSGGVVAVARTIRKEAPAPEPALTAGDLLLEGWSALLTQDCERGTQQLREAIRLARRETDLKLIGLAWLAAIELWDDDALCALALRRVRLARESGALTVLPRALSQLGSYEVMVGRLDAAEETFADARDVSEASGHSGIIGRTDPGALIVATWRGAAGPTRDYADRCIRDGTARGIGTFVSFAQYSLAILELGQSGYEAALAAAQRASDDPSVATRTLPELVEAAVRCGERDVAAAAIERLAQSATASGTSWGLGVLARSRALVEEGPRARDHYEEAIAHLERCRARPELARARLVYGEWLRRRKRRREAREQLRLAHDLFTSMDLGGFADRAAIELFATGEHVRRQTAEAPELLTPHELRIARLASFGETNAAIARQLSLSPRTVEYHLRKVFRKLGLTSRAQLTQALLDVADGPS
jgi:DNA-binding CsgD family transcriptional regulator